MKVYTKEKETQRQKTNLWLKSRGEGAREEKLGVWE